MAYHDVLHLALKTIVFEGYPRLTNASPMPPFATIATNLLILPLALWIWRVSGWPWFFLSGAFIFAVNAAVAGQGWGYLAGNAAEVVFITGLIQTECFFQARSGRDTAPVS